MQGSLNRILHLVRSYVSSMPAYLIFFVTSRCNAYCKMCFNWRRQEEGRDELSLNEINKISFNFNNLLQVTLSGGEPFLRDDIPSIVECFYRNSNARFFTISTNGFFTEKIESNINEILKRCPHILLNLGLSMDSVGDLHDEIRGLKESFKKLLQTYNRSKMIRKKHSNFFIKITTVISSFNSNIIEAVLDFVRKNLDIDNHEILLARGDMRLKEAKDVMPVRYRDLAKIFNKNTKINLAKRKYQFSRLFYGLYRYMNILLSETLEKKQLILPCLAGRRLIEIYEDGTVRPCEILHTFPLGLDSDMGNLRDYNYNIRDVLRSEKAEKILQYIKLNKCFCTFECALLSNIIFNYRTYPGLFKNIF